jgi:hypothetical protein
MSVQSTPARAVDTTTSTTSTLPPASGLSPTSSSSTAVPTTTVPTKPGALFILGDSLCLGAEIFGKLSTAVKSTNKWSAVVSDCKLGRRALDGLSIVTKALETRADYSGVVVALGTNDLLSRREKAYPAWIIEQMMSRAKGKPVLWVEVTYGGVHPDYVGRARRFNSALADAAKKYPNLAIAPWFAAYPSKTRSWERDGIHPTVSGYRTRATFLTKEISTFATFVASRANR